MTKYPPTSFVPHWDLIKFVYSFGALKEIFLSLKAGEFLAGVATCGVKNARVRTHDPTIQLFFKCSIFFSKQLLFLEISTLASNEKIEHETFSSCYFVFDKPLDIIGKLCLLYGLIVYQWLWEQTIFPWPRLIRKVIFIIHNL